MFIIFIGILALVASNVLAKIPHLATLGTGLRWAGVGILILGLASACTKQISAGNVGVQTLFGQVQPGVLSPGLNFVNPLIEVTEFNTKTQEYTMSASHSEGEKVGDDAIRVLTNDGLEVVIDLTVLYRVLPDQAPNVLSTIGRDYKNTIVRPVTRTRIRDNAVFFDAIALYSTKREEFQQRIFASIDKDFKERGLVLENLLIRNINLPDAVKTTIEGKIQAEQESQKMKFVLDKERQEADRKRVEAQGIADYQRIVGQSLTANQLQYESIKAQKELAASPNAKIIIMGSGKSAPIILGNQ
jgi:regulator of protease activity HflC (stomatin/prohibitin superfamily)